MRRASRFVVTPAIALSFAACADESPTAYVTFNVPVDAECVASPTPDEFLPVGLFDIGADGEGACAVPYSLNLLVNSNLRPNARESTGRAEPNVLQLHSAEVRLMNIQKQTIEFERRVDGEVVTLPNPFLVTTANSLPPAQSGRPSTGIASIEAIPADYAPFLNNYAGQQILAEVQIFGTTLGEVDVDFKPFTYAIRLCDGCLTRCLGDLEADGLTPDDVYAGECADNAGADGRVCVDPDC